MKKPFVLLAASGAVLAALAAGIYAFTNTTPVAAVTAPAPTPAATTAKAASAPTEAVTLIGDYFGIEYSDTEEPHAESGYNLDLYKQGNRIFGSIVIANGSIEPWQASIYDVVYNEQQKTISFKAKYAGGMQYENDKEREARILLTFSGKISKDQVEGTVTKVDGYSNRPSEDPEKVVIKKSDGEPDVPKSYEEWDKSHSHPIPNW